MVKHWLYKKFSTFYKPDASPLSIKVLAQLLEKIFGYAIFSYGDIKLTAGPYALLDHYIIRGYNINPFVTSAIKQYLAEGGIFLDIGANHGVFSLLAGKNPKTKVFAFEPSPRELRRLWKNLEINNNNNISVFSYGLGEDEGNKDFVLSADDNPGMNSLPNICEKGKKIRCNFTSLIKLLSPNILMQSRVCKMDVEGQEMFILKSLKNHMHLFKNCVFILEMHSTFLGKAGFTTDQIYDFFKEAGFNYQFGNLNGTKQWEEFFYHPAYSSELIFSQGVNC